MEIVSLMILNIILIRMLGRDNNWTSKAKLCSEMKKNVIDL